MSRYELVVIGGGFAGFGWWTDIERRADSARNNSGLAVLGPLAMWFMPAMMDAGWVEWNDELLRWHDGHLDSRSPFRGCDCGYQCLTCFTQVVAFRNPSGRQYRVNS
jgi:hypothetical protein